MDIKRQAEKLCTTHLSRNPFDIANSMNIHLLFEPLGTLKGFYQSIYKQKIVHINEDLPYEEQKFTLAHELGHIILHPTINTSFLKTKTLFCVDKLENEANKFAVQLLYDDDTFNDLISFGEYKIAETLCLNVSLVQYKLSTIKIINK